MKSSKERQLERHQAAIQRLKAEDENPLVLAAALCCGAPNPVFGLVASNRWAERHRNGHRRHPDLPRPGLRVVAGASSVSETRVLREESPVPAGGYRLR